MTNDSFILLARYNAAVNVHMGKVIAGLSEREWDQEFGGYYKSVHSLCGHIFIADLNWLKRLGSVRSFACLGHEMLTAEHPWDAKLFKSISEYLPLRAALDGLWSAFVLELNQADLDFVLEYMNWQGEPQKRQIAGLLLHVFNHQTHHRGMISLYLELLGHANDFSSLVPYV